VLIDHLVQFTDLDTVVHVHHGPVRYEDSSGRITTQDDWATIGDRAGARPADRPASPPR
jgi:hypothetical protein